MVKCMEGEKNKCLRKVWKSSVRMCVKGMRRGFECDRVCTKGDEVVSVL